MLSGMREQLKDSKSNELISMTDLPVGTVLFGKFFAKKNRPHWQLVYDRSRTHDGGDPDFRQDDTYDQSG